jgi:hypothetical protein
MEPWRVIDTQWRVEAQNGILEGLQTSGRKSDNFEEQDPKSLMRIRILLKSWIRIRISVMRTRDPAIGNADQIRLFNKKRII